MIGQLTAEGTIHTFNNHRQFAIKHNLHANCVGYVLAGKRKTHKGFKKL